MTPVSISAAEAIPGLITLPWHIPLEAWPDELITALPKGISRHVVRFTTIDCTVVAVKETTPELARSEFDLLKQLVKANIPCVEPLAVVTSRSDSAGESLPAALITKHLKFSIPFRALYSTTLRPETLRRLIDALALLLVRLHNYGFFWGDVSLSNTLFVRDAGAFAAYLVDAETGRLYPSLTDGQRAHDLEIARVNIAGELMDLQAGSRMDESIDPVMISDRIMAAYESLWHALNDPEVLAQHELWKIHERVQHLNDLGFDIEELDITTDESGTTVRIQPKVVDAGHHARRLLRLTGLDTEENQARRLLNDLDEYRARVSPTHLDEEVVAHMWLTRVFEPVVTSIPERLERKLEDAEVFHQVLEHRWYMSEREKRDVTLEEAVRNYIETVLVNRRDEELLINPPTGAITAANRLPTKRQARKRSSSSKKSMSFGMDDEEPPPRDADEPEVDWRDLV